MNRASRTDTVEGMTRGSGRQPQQRTVAELLAQYGGKVDGGRRHRHRRPDEEAGTPAESDITATAPQAIIDRVHSEVPQVDWESAARNGHSSHGYSEQNGQPVAGKAAKAPAPPANSAAPLAKAPAVPPKAAPPPAPRQKSVAARRDDLAQAPAPEVAPPTRQWSRGPARAPEPSTDQFDAYTDDEYADYQRELDARVPESGVNLQPRRRQFDDLDADPHPLDLEAGHSVLEDHVDYDDEYDRSPVESAEPIDDRTPGQQWLAVAWQLALGVIGGAVVWLLFNWIWTQHPAIALGAAVLVTVGLVWIVRNLRKAEDLQTTVLAVLVGLVVTVSPAAMLLLSR